MDWIQQWQSKLNKQNGVAPLVRTGGSRHTGLAALPYRNIQEQEFLEVCSSYDHDLLTGKKEMTLKDYERITYLVSSLGYSQYLQFLIGKYMDLAQADEEREEREHEIYLEYQEYYEDEGILEEEKWLEEFLNQLPEKKREYFEKLIKES